MTTNKPEVVTWRFRKPVVNDQGETVGDTAWELSDAPGFLPWWANEPLIRLSDYEALQVECEKLVEALEWLRGTINCTPENDKYQCGTWISTKHPRIKQIDAILATYRKQGGEK